LTDKILLGYEVGSGEPVFVPLHHLAIFGMTQLSGKTTTLEGLISRSGLRAIAFITKRGEAGFTRYNLVTPYYKPRADWQFVEGLVNVALGEKVKYEPGMRYGIMKVCKGHKDLKEIQKAALELARESKREFMRAVYEKLAAYLEIVIPELEKWVFTDKLDLSEGINVMDLSGMRLETQHLVIASTIEYAFANLDHVIVIIPEAWETIPQGKMTPVKWVAQQFIRKGAALGNYLWLDSQDIGGIDKTPLRQCDNWLMGRMKEAHEVERILKQLLGMKVPAEEIQTLPLGHFYATIGNEVKKVYVLPVGVPEEVGRDVALGKRSPESVRDSFLKPKVMEVNDLVWKEKYEEERKKRIEIENKLKEIEQKLTSELWAPISDFDKLKEENLAFKQQLEQDKGIIESLQKNLKDLDKRFAKLQKESEAVEKIREGLLQLLPISNIPEVGVATPNSVGLQATTTIVDVAPVEKSVVINTDTVPGKILWVAKKGKLDGWRQLGEVVKAVEEERWTVTPQQINNALNDLVKDGLIAKRHTDRNYFCLAQGVSFAKEDK
jgi:hypothetical protein